MNWNNQEKYHHLRWGANNQEVYNTTLWLAIGIREKWGKGHAMVCDLSDCKIVKDS